MSTIALKMPTDYVDVSDDEMMYVEGGSGFITFYVHRNVINAAVAVGATAAATAALAAVGITGGLSLVVVPGIAGIIGACMSNSLLKYTYYAAPVYISSNFQYNLLNAISGFDRKITLQM